MKTYALPRHFCAVFALACLLLFSSDTAFAVSPEEQPRIEALLVAIGKQEDLIFIRNGSEYTAQEAVSHLGLKLRRAGSRINTAEEFIDHLASNSSFSGKSYMIKRQGQPEEAAGPFLHRLLREVAPSFQ